MASFRFYSVIAIAFAAVAFGPDLFNRAYPVHKSGVILITGASTGIGYDAALRLHGLGFHVIGTVRNEKSAAILRQHNIVPVLMDVTDPHAILATLEFVKSELDRTKLKFVGLVNNAGMGVFAPTELATDELIRTVFEINVFGLLNTTRVFLPLLRRDKGRIVMISSISGEISAEFQGIYSGTKHALEALSIGLRAELYSQDVAVVVVAPGPIKTNITDKSKFDFVVSKLETSAELQKVYSKFISLRSKVDEFLASLETVFWPVSTTSDAIQTAFLSAHPPDRIVVSHFIVRVVRFLTKYILPVQLSDRLNDANLPNLD